MPQEKIPTVSVIIPTHNRAHLIGRAIESVLNQSYTDLELIVVDDGSTDNTRQVVASYRDERLHYLWQEQSERSVARNSGIRASRGRYIAFLDSDDWFLPNKFAIQVPILESQPKTGLVIGGWQIVDSQGRTIRKAQPWLVLPSQPTLEDWLFSVTGKLCATLIRKECVEQVGGFDPSIILTEDMDLMIRLVLGGCQIGWSPQIVAVGLWHGENSLHNVEKVKEGRLAFLNKLFTQYDLTGRLNLSKDEVYSRQYLAFACYEYASGQEEAAQRDLSISIKYDPTLLANRGRHLVSIFAQQTNSHRIGEPFAYLDFLFAHLPEDLIWLKRYKRRSIGEVWATRTFQAYSNGDWTGARSAVWRTVQNDWHWLRNRGFLSIWIQSLLGGRRFWTRRNMPHSWEL